MGGCEGKQVKQASERRGGGKGRGEDKGLFERGKNPLSGGGGKEMIIKQKIIGKYASKLVVFKLNNEFDDAVRKVYDESGSISVSKV